MGTISVTTQDSTLWRHHEFEQTVRLVHRKCLTIGTPERLLADIVDALFLAKVFRQTHTSSFWLGEDGSRHDVETDVIGLSKYLIDHMNCLHLSSMCQHLTTIHITNGIDMWNGGLEVFVDDNACTF